MSEVPVVTDASGLARHAGRVVCLRGEYQPDFNAAQKTLLLDADGNVTSAGCIVLVKLADGSFVDIFDRPEDEGSRLKGKPVGVTGTLCAPDPQSSDEVACEQPLYHMIRITGIELAD